MTKEQIKELVAQKIAGQGTMVDVGGALPAILNGIIDLIESGGGTSGNIINPGWDLSEWDETEGGVTRDFSSLEEAGLADLNEGSVVCVKVNDTNTNVFRMTLKDIDTGEEPNVLNYTFLSFDNPDSIAESAYMIFIEKPVDADNCTISIYSQAF